MANSAQEQHREWSRAEVEASLREILVDSLGRQEAEVIPSASLVKDLGAESIDFLDIGFKIQQTFGVNLQTAEIRDIIMAWGSLIHPTLAEILTGRYNLTVTVDELRGLEKGGLDKILEHLRSAQGFTGTPEAADEIGRELLRRLVKEFAAFGLTVNEADHRDLLGVMRTDLSARRITERTLNLLSVGALVNFICAKLGPRLRAA
ncbi:MAG TPA: acyl carrier protein [Candidatus Methylomirabilis sp.]